MSESAFMRILFSMNTLFFFLSKHLLLLGCGCGFLGNRCLFRLGRLLLCIVILVIVIRVGILLSNAKSQSKKEKKVSCILLASWQLAWRGLALPWASLLHRRHRHLPTCQNPPVIVCILFSTNTKKVYLLLLGSRLGNRGGGLLCLGRLFFCIVVLVLVTRVRILFFFFQINQ